MSVRPRRHRRRRSVAGWMLLVQSAVLLVGGVAVFAALGFDAQASASADAENRAQSAVAALAVSPTVRDVVGRAHLTLREDRAQTVAAAADVLQPYVADILGDVGVDYITIMDTDRTRYTHPNAAEIGGTFVGSVAPALRGETFTETYTGTLGPSLRVVAPVTRDGEIVGMVSAGVTIENLSREVMGRLVIVGLATVAAVAVAGAVLLIVFRRISRLTDGRDPDELAQLFASQEAVLHSLDEGLVLTQGNADGDDLRVVVANDRAIELLKLDDPEHSPAAPLPGPIARAIVGAESGRIVRIGGRDLILSRTEVQVGGRPADVILVRDRTDLSRTQGELASVRTLSDALRSQVHEFDNRLHTIATLIELGETTEALSFATAEQRLGQRLTDRVVGAPDEPVIAALMLGKTAQAHERAVQMHFETHLEPGTQGLAPHDVVTILGNLIDNAIEAAAERLRDDAWVEVYLADDDDMLVFQVSDSGPGIAPEDRERVFRRGATTKTAAASSHGYGLALVRDVVDALGGSIEIADAVGGGAMVTVTVPRPDRAGSDSGQTA